MSLRAIVAEAQSEAKRKQSHGKYVLLGIAKPVPSPARNLAPRNDSGASGNDMTESTERKLRLTIDFHSSDLVFNLDG